MLWIYALLCECLGHYAASILLLECKLLKCPKVNTVHWIALRSDFRHCCTFQCTIWTSHHFLLVLNADSRLGSLLWVESFITFSSLWLSSPQKTNVWRIRLSSTVFTVCSTLSAEGPLHHTSVVSWCGCRMWNYSLTLYLLNKQAQIPRVMLEVTSSGDETGEYLIIFITWKWALQ